MFTISNYRPGELEKFDILKDSIRAFDIVAGENRKYDYGTLLFSFAIDSDKRPIVAPYFGFCDTSIQEALAKGLAIFLHQYSNDKEGRSIDMRILANWFELMGAEQLLFIERECRKRLDKIKDGRK